MNFSETELEALADLLEPRIKARIAKTPDAPMSVNEASAALNVSPWNIRSRIAANLIPTIPGYGRILIPAAWVTREMEGKNQ